MTRPVDISVLLKQKKSGPRLLSKEERDELVRTREDAGEGRDEVITVPYKRKLEQGDEDEDDRDEAMVSEATKAKIRAALSSKKSHIDEIDEYLGKHWRDKELKEMDDRDWRIFMEDYSIRTSGKGTVRKPLRNWGETRDLPDSMVSALRHTLKFEEPTAIQRAVIPNAIGKNKRDVLGVASTGSGKTLAFIIPILIKLAPRPITLKVMDGPLALVLVPTRELAQQIETETNKLLSAWRNEEVSVVSIVGGHSMEDISHSLKSGCDILIATPGRLLDCLSNHILVINSVHTLVLDEADRMIDLGFEEQLKNLLSQITSTTTTTGRQTMLFTATMSPAIQSIATGFMENQVNVTVGSTTGSDSKPLITQIVKLAENEDRKLKLLQDDLRNYGTPAIVFINYKETADWLANQLSKSRFQVVTLHGSKSQDQREKTIQRMKRGEADVMIATNVAARGLDISNIALVVNFQMSKKFEDYVHRIGRTGRAGQTGTAITYLSGEEDHNLVKQLYKYSKETNTTEKNHFSRECIATFGIKSTNDRILY